MTEEDLATVTGMKRYSKQIAWFRSRFGIEPVQAATGRPIITWAAFEALQAKHADVGRAAEAAARPALRPVKRQ